MNARIEEIAKQAKEYADGWSDAHTASWFHFYNEKFAELLIQECHALVDYENKQFIKAQFKEHFGVK